jgi:transposase
MVCIGTEVTDELVLEPARFYIKRYIRYKCAPKGNTIDDLAIGQLPGRVIDKGIPGPGLLATILVDKYMDHIPLYRQRQRFQRENIPIAQSTLDGWAGQAMGRLEILYDHLVADTKTQGYLQVVGGDRSRASKDCPSGPAAQKKASHCRGDCPDGRARGQSL